jgi:hypothetical protein
MILAVEATTNTGAAGVGLFILVATILLLLGGRKR